MRVVTVSPDLHRTARVVMNDTEKAALWRQRMFEAETGMTRFLAERAGQTHVADWLRVRADIFIRLPDPGSADPTAWQRAFFFAQAVMEKFLVARYGEDALADWALANAESYRDVEPDHGGGTADTVGRIGRQAELYASDYEVVRSTPAGSSIVISHCAIWDYRERARRNGVPITLDSPCTYCTKAIAANVRAKGQVATHRLTTSGDSHGCRWDVVTSEPDDTGRVE